MAGFIGFVLFLLGFILSFVGLALPSTLLPQPYGGTLWKVLLGIVLSVAGIFIAEQGGHRGTARFSAGLLALLGVGLLVEALLPAVFNLSLFTTGGTVLRTVLGMLFVGAGYWFLEATKR